MPSPSVPPISLPPGKGHAVPRGAGQRIRVTNRSRLRIYYGSLEADSVILDEDGSGNGFATAGVDAEDAKEHHLQVVLSLQSLEGSWSNTIKEEEGEKDEKDESTKERDVRAFIPVPDAAGLIADPDYEHLYSSGSPWKDSTEYIRFSDTIDETLESGLRDGYTYDLDDGDEYWMQRHEQDPDGHGNHTPGGRTSRMKTKTKEIDMPALNIEKSEYELAMGLLEMLCDSLRPTLHTDLSKIPGLSDMEEHFVHELEEEYFATYEVPSTVPKPERLWSLVRTLYPFWKEQRLARGGHRIVPQLNTDETLEDDHFVCFRRRDPKAIRRTRRSDTTHIEKLARLRMDFEQLEDIARSSLIREQKKSDQVLSEQTLYEARKRFSHVARRPEVSHHPDDDKLLLPNYQEPKLLVQLPTKKVHRLEESLLRELQRQKTVNMREVVAEQTKQAYRKRKLEDEDYENQITAIAQPKIQRTGMYEFQWVSQEVKTDNMPLSPRVLAEQGTNVGFRVRRGRGGTIRCDRLLPRHARRHLAEGKGLFTRKPLAVEASSDSQKEDVSDSLPALSSDSDLTASSSDSEGAKESFRRYFFGTVQASSDPDLVKQGIQVVDDYDVQFSRRRALLHDPGKPNPLHTDNSYFVAAHSFIRETRTKESKVPLWPSMRPTLAPVRISGLKVAIPQAPQTAIALHAIKTTAPPLLPGQVHMAPSNDRHAVPSPGALQAGGHSQSNSDPPQSSHSVYPRSANPSSAVGEAVSPSKPGPPPPSASPKHAVASRPQHGEHEALPRYPIPSANHTGPTNGLGLQLGPTDLKLVTAATSPVSMFPQAQPYAGTYNQSLSGPTIRSEGVRSGDHQRMPQPGMPAVPPYTGMPMTNYPLYPQNAGNPAATAAYYAQTMNGLGLAPGQTPQGPSMFHPQDYGRYYTQLWQAYHAMNPGHGNGSPHPHQPGSGEVPQHLQHGFRLNSMDLQSFAQYQSSGLNLRVPQVRQKPGLSSAVPMQTTTPERHTPQAYVSDHPPTYPTPLTRPPSEPRDLESSPSGPRRGSDSGTDNGVSSPANPSTLPTTPISQPAVSQGKSPIE
ncbi:hypothetical protein DACRYDRAFT_110602 [Dacryopinax primogenitus]|uniref:Enhancer of polycomb-like protein n=1 Tax=Dacryopinax primogenitus (strain DJM 731) TaxID=1858805 RepID=M5FTJ3_DACPD|nr:uncharacterized protein DACRYDRAFT_110602 [Dacryopinax primogenitus]EJT98699.1 hypothetical protein DACRYDRAFT_110602 [Dacryopinax primogenitus]